MRKRDSQASHRMDKRRQEPEAMQQGSGPGQEVQVTGSSPLPVNSEPRDQQQALAAALPQRVQPPGDRVGNTTPQQQAPASVLPQCVQLPLMQQPVAGASGLASQLTQPGPGWNVSGPQFGWGPGWGFGPWMMTGQYNMPHWCQVSASGQPTPVRQQSSQTSKKRKLGPCSTTA